MTDQPAPAPAEAAITEERREKIAEFIRAYSTSSDMCGLASGMLETLLAALRQRDEEVALLKGQQALSASQYQATIKTMARMDEKLAAANKAALAAEARLAHSGVPVCCVTGRIAGDSDACGDCDPCGAASRVPDVVKALLKEKEVWRDKYGATAAEMDARLAQANEALTSLARDAKAFVDLAMGGRNSGLREDAPRQVRNSIAVARSVIAAAPTTSPTQRAQSAGQLTDFDRGVVRSLKETYAAANEQLYAAGLIERQASALAEARNSALEEAAKIVEGQSTAANYMPLSEPMKMLDWVTRRDFRIAGLIRALKPKGSDHG